MISQLCAPAPSPLPPITTCLPQLRPAPPHNRHELRPAIPHPAAGLHALRQLPARSYAPNVARCRLLLPALRCSGRLAITARLAQGPEPLATRLARSPVPVQHVRLAARRSRALVQLPALLPDAAAYARICKWFLWLRSDEPASPRLGGDAPQTLSS